MRVSCCSLLAVFVTLPLVSEAAERPVAAEKNWHRPPTLAVMTGFIKQPRKPYTIREWEKGLGHELDADRWVKDFKEAGATYLIFYDKWIDGYVFHDTKTTNFKTSHDFLRDIADACHRGGLRLVIYFNSISDGNPEFDKWSLLDRQGKPIVFNKNWPTRYQTLHSPFRRVSVEQVRELMTHYGRIDGMWLDIFNERLDTSSPWVARGYERMYGTPFEQASPLRLREFNARTLAGYLDEVRPLADKHQPNCLWTSNGSDRRMFQSGVWARWVGPRLEYRSNEGHSFHRMDRLARTAWMHPKPLEIGLLLCSSWFTPMEDVAPPPKMTRSQAIAAAAIAVCQGASVYMALTPDHSGVFGEDLQLAKAVGAWFKKTEPLVKDARPHADVSIVLGTPALDGPGMAGSNDLWTRYEATQMSTDEEAFAISDALAREGVFSRFLYAHGDYGNWPSSLADARAVLLPERAMLDEVRARELKRYVEHGGRLIAFGHASLLDAKGQRHEDYALADLFGARFQGEVVFPAESRKTVVVDSEYFSEDSARNLVRGSLNSWYSEGTPMAVKVEATTAQVIARANDENGPPMILTNRYGDGEAMLITAGEGAFQGNPSFWSWLGRHAVGNPTLTCSEKDRYRIIVTRVGNAHAVHLIDTATGDPAYETKTVRISLETKRFGDLQGAWLVGSEAALKTTRDEGKMTFELRPDPVASVLLK